MSSWAIQGDVGGIGFNGRWELCGGDISDVAANTALSFEEPIFRIDAELSTSGVHDILAI